MQALLKQAQSPENTSAYSTCTSQLVLIQVAIIPMIVHPFIFLICSDEFTGFFCCTNSRHARASGGAASWRKDYAAGRNDVSVFDSAFMDEPSSRAGPCYSHTRDRSGELDPMLVNNNNNGRRMSAKRNVCFELEVNSRPKSFFLDLWHRSKPTPQRKPTRHWKRYSAGSSEPMSLFSSSSSSSINHIHQIVRGPLPDASYKRERIARRSSAFKSSSNISSCTPSNSSGRDCVMATVLFLEDMNDNNRRRSSF